MPRFISTLTFCLFLLATARADKAVLVAGGGDGGDGGDGSDALKAKLIQPFAIDFDAEGLLHFVEMNGGDRLRMIDAKGQVQTLAGTGKKGYSGDEGDASKAEFNGMHDMLFRDDGSILLADSFNAVVRKYDPKTKQIEAFAGNGKKGFDGDGGPAKDATFAEVISIVQSADRKTLYLADIKNKRIRAIDYKTGTVTTFAGNGKVGIPKDGEPAKEQPLVDPRAVTSDNDGNIYILERSGHALRVVKPDGTIKTVAGTGKAGYSGDGGAALKATFNGPKFIEIDRDGSVLIVDTENHAIRRYDPKKETVEAVAGTGKKGDGFDADPKKLELNRPHGVSVHPKTGAIYIADSDNGRIVRIDRE